MLAASVRSLSLPLNQLKPSGNSSLLNGFGSLTWCAWRNFNPFPLAQLAVPHGSTMCMKAIWSAFSELKKKEVTAPLLCWKDLLPK